MTMKKWGGWILVILGVCVLMTMGCEKGALGVKSTTVMGHLVDSERPTVPIVGARVQMRSNTEFGSGEVKTGQQFFAVTNADGLFVFEGVQSDKMQLEAFASGYLDLKYPTASATQQFFYVPNGSTLNLGTLKMQQIANPLTTDTVIVKGKILDAASKDELDDAQMLSFYFDGRKYNNADVTYAQFKAGLTIDAKLGEYDMTIITPNYATYRSADDTSTTVSGEVDNVLNLELTPISYNVRVTFKNKPGYMDDRVVNLGTGGTSTLTTADKCFVTVTSSIAKAGKPYKVLQTGTVDLDAFEPSVILNDISLPASLTVLMYGYIEMEFAVPYTAETQGTIPMELDMTSATFANSVITRPLLITLTPETPAENELPIPLASDDNVQVTCLDKKWGLAPLNTIDADAPNPSVRPLPCGYILPFQTYAEIASDSTIARTPNFYYVDPVTVPAGGNTASLATFTANLLLSRKAHVIRP